jgi:hypothetical protein
MVPFLINLIGCTYAAGSENGKIFFVGIANFNKTIDMVNVPEV